MRKASFPFYALRNERFEPVPKRVLELPTFANHSGRRDKEIWEDLATLHQNLAIGRPLGRDFYRARIGLDADHLLEATGIKHLHLGRWELGVLLYAVETVDSVLLLEINGHRHVKKRGRCFDAEAVGAALLAVHTTPLDRECRVLEFPTSKAA